ncbi:hypothetical protein Trydic_g2307 [Trypoxylus dichotomus]
MTATDSIERNGTAPSGNACLLNRSSREIRKTLKDVAELKTAESSTYGTGSATTKPPLVEEIRRAYAVRNRCNTCSEEA